MIESAIQAKMVSTTAITNLVGQRVYVGQAPQSVTYPFITVNRVSLEKAPQNSSERVRVQFTMFGDTAVKADKVTTEVRKLFYRYIGPIGSFDPVECVHDRSQYFYESTTTKHIFTDDIFFRYFSE